MLRMSGISPYVLWRATVGIVDTKAEIKIYFSGDGINPLTGGINPPRGRESIVLETVVP